MWHVTCDFHPSRLKARQERWHKQTWKKQLLLKSLSNDRFGFIFRLYKKSGKGAIRTATLPTHLSEEPKKNSNQIDYWK